MNMNKEIGRQLDIIASRTVDLVSKEELRTKIQKSLKTHKPLRVKYGADPSAPDIHLGHVVALNKLRKFQDLGHQVVFIIGDFTGMIGDPSGRSETRTPLSRETIAANAKTYQDQVFRILDPQKTEIRFNSEWCDSLSFEHVIRLLSYVTVAQMLARDDFHNRFFENQSISLVEFLYPLIQGYDSVMINADIELGGTDQLFNLLLGRGLQKSFGKDQQVVMTLPLLEGLDGVRKMSKSLGNYIAVTESAREMFGKIMSVPDNLMWHYYSLVLCKSDSDIQAMREAVKNGKEHPRMLKDNLAREVVTRFHGHAAAMAASEEFERVFSRHKLPDAIPIVTIPMSQRKNDRIWVVSLLVSAGLAENNSAARRLIGQGAVSVGNKKITDVQVELEIPDGCIIQSGKRGFARIISGTNFKP